MVVVRAARPLSRSKVRRGGWNVLGQDYPTACCPFAFVPQVELWGRVVLGPLAEDLCDQFPQMRGLLRRKLRHRWALADSREGSRTIVQILSAGFSLILFKRLENQSGLSNVIGGAGAGP